MANDKRIRITSDLTPLQELRQGAQSLLSDLTRAEDKFYKIANESVVKIQNQVDLLKERNTLLNQGSLTIRGGGTTNIKAEARQAMTDMLTMEQKFNKLSEDSIFNLEYEIMLIKERNDLFIGGISGSSIGGGSPPINPATQNNNNSSGRNSNYSVVLGKILSVNTKSARSLEHLVGKIEDIVSKMSKVGSGRSGSGKSGGSGGGGSSGIGNITPGTSSTHSANRGIRGTKGGLTNFSLASALRAVPYAGAIMAVGSMIGKQRQFESQQYTAENRFARENNVGNHWLLNMLTFGGSGARATELEKDRESAKINDTQIRRYSALHNTSYIGALNKQLSGSDFSKYMPPATEHTIHEKAIHQNSYEKAIDLQSKGLSNAAITRRMMSDNAMLMDLSSAIARLTTSEEKKKKKKVVIEQKPIIGEEVSNWASTNLGMNMTDYLGKVVDYQAAGVKGRNTTGHDINQLLLAGRIRGLTDSDATSVLKTTRFGDDSMGASGVVRALDLNLQKMGKTNQEIASTLSEYLSQFNNMSQSLLEKTGTFSTEKVVQSLTSIQRATGAEGKQLERYQNAFMGKDISKDDTTQALLMRTARSLNPGASIFDLQSDIEKMQNDPKLQRAFLARIEKMTGGGEMLKHVMKAIFTGLSNTDIMEYTQGKLSSENLFNRGTTHTGYYQDKDAASKVGLAEVSGAGTTNKHIVHGIEQTSGKSLKEILEHIEKPIPVMLIKNQTEVPFSPMLPPEMLAYQAFLDKLDVIFHKPKSVNSPMIITKE